MSDNEWTKICGVCGDKAIAKNFGAVSCESCKAFFRRNASKMNVYKCYFDNKCKIDAITRKFCRRCRLRKCFEIGMKQEWILSEEQKQMRRKKIEEKKQNRKDSLHSSGASDTTNGSFTETQDSDSIELFDNNISDDEIITNIMEIEKYIHSEDIDKNDDISDDVYQKAVELEFAVLPIVRPLPPNNNTFNDMECNRLTELFSALKIMATPVTQRISEVNASDNPRVICGYLSKKLERDIINMVTVSKSLDSFNSLCENDQISLLKYGSTEVFSLRSILNLNFENNNWRFVLDDNISIIIKLEFFKNDTNCVYEMYHKFLKKFNKEFNSDSVILDLMTAIVLFNPDRPNLIHKDMVKLQQQIYMYLLQRYLLLKYRSECESKEKFLRLLNTLHDLNALHKLQLKAKREKNPELFGPLVREILDIES